MFCETTHSRHLTHIYLHHHNYQHGKLERQNLNEL